MQRYKAHIENLRRLEKQHDNFRVIFRSNLSDNTLLYVKDGAGAVMCKTDLPMSAFVISDSNMVNAFWDYFEKNILCN